MGLIMLWLRTRAARSMHALTRTGGTRAGGTRACARARPARGARVSAPRADTRMRISVLRVRYRTLSSI